MGSTTTTLVTHDGKTITNSGTSGFAVTATRIGDEVAVHMDFDIRSEEECVAMIGTLLTQIEELHGENLVAQCFAHYADETGKTIRRPGQRDVALIQGHKRET